MVSAGFLTNLNPDSVVTAERSSSKCLICSAAVSNTLIQSTDYADYGKPGSRSSRQEQDDPCPPAPASCSCRLLPPLLLRMSCLRAKLASPGSVPNCIICL